MRYFLDVEFNGFCGELISIALVPEQDGAAPFYEALDCAKPTPWVADHVLPVLRTAPIPRTLMASRFAAYLANDENPVLIADWPEDIAQAAMLMVIAPGRRVALDRITFRMIDSIGFDAAALSAVPHNAYHDALALRDYMIGRDTG
ncbi:hypothetical protein BH11PSE6_BH11PSE6_19440 [soil metagenome]